MTELLIRGADLNGRGRSDLLIRNGRFVDPSDAGRDVDRLDADGLIALPVLSALMTSSERSDDTTISTLTFGSRSILYSWPR